jgi:hypothetical protein
MERGFDRAAALFGLSSAIVARRVAARRSNVGGAEQGPRRCGCRPRATAAEHERSEGRSAVPQQAPHTAQASQQQSPNSTQMSSQKQPPSAAPPHVPGDAQPQSPGQLNCVSLPVQLPLPQPPQAQSLGHVPHDSPSAASQIPSPHVSHGPQSGSHVTHDSPAPG